MKIRDRKITFGEVDSTAEVCKFFNQVYEMFREQQAEIEDLESRCKNLESRCKKLESRCKELEKKPKAKPASAAKPEENKK
jgi:cell division septum initiation protein DivIVA